ncbi:MAG: right-handed parallel beta-helix repeat-containing protein, partial [Chitinivibrionales bacterium]|nr:right-handed parallel beta-helix repeat-containing protein [Chitinivibrionales bacterium]
SLPIYQSYPGEQAIISGGKLLSGFTVGSDGRWTLNLKAAYTALWNSGWQFGQIWVNGKNASWPIRPTRGSDRFRIAAAAAQSAPPQYSDPVLPTQVGDRWSLVQGGIAQYANDRFGFNAGELNPNWTNLTDVRIEACSKGSASNIIPIKSISGTTVTMISHAFDIDVGSAWRRMNVYEDLDQTSGGAHPGEFYLNRSTGLLTYVPRSGETPASSTIIAPALYELIIIANTPRYTATAALAGNITFKGLTFSHTNSNALNVGVIGVASGLYTDPVGAVSAVGAANITFDGCTFEHLGSEGVIFGQGSNHNTVQNCLAHDLGGGAFWAGAKDRDKTSVADSLPANVNNPRTAYTDVGNTTFSNNLVYDFGTVYTLTAGLFISRGPSNRIIHNEIYNGPSFGVVLGDDPGTDIDAAYPTSNGYVGYNHIHDMGFGGSAFTADFGGLYTVGPQVGTIIEYNKIHDIYSSFFTPNGHDAIPLYNDDRSSGLTIRFNLVYATNNKIEQTKGMHHSEYNNILFSAYGAHSGGYGNDGHFPMIHSPPLIAGELAVNFTRNIVQWSTPNNPVETPQADIYVQTTNFQADSNLYFQNGVTLVNYAPNISFAGWRALGRDVHSIVNQDPLFNNPATGDFSLKAGSPALTLGFIDFSAAIANAGTTGAVGAQ